MTEGGKYRFFSARELLSGLDFQLRINILLIHEWLYLVYQTCLNRSPFSFLFTGYLRFRQNYDNKIYNKIYELYIVKKSDFLATRFRPQSYIIYFRFFFSASLRGSKFPDLREFGLYNNIINHLWRPRGRRVGLLSSKSKVKFLIERFISLYSKNEFID